MLANCQILDRFWAITEANANEFVGAVLRLPLKAKLDHPGEEFRGDFYCGEIVAKPMIHCDLFGDAFN